MGRLITGADYTGTIGGNITVNGTPERQTISVADVAGTVTFDASFNRGGDTIVLAKSAASYTIAQSGSTVILSDGDSRIVIPVGTVANTIQFSDGDRALLFSSGVKIGSQALTSTATTVTAEGTAKSALAADAATQAARLVLNEESAWVGGNATVYGSSGAENVSIVGASKITFDASFNKGGDTISLSKAANNYSAQRSSSSVVLKDGATTLNIPVGTVGLTAEFNGDKRAVLFANGDFKVGQLTIPSNAPIALATSKYFSEVKSSSVTASTMNLFTKGISVEDVNNDGRKDIIVSNEGKGSEPIKNSDGNVSIFFANADKSFSKIDTSYLPPVGILGDFIFTDYNKNGFKEIIAIDSGREVGDWSGWSAYWQKLQIYEWDGTSFKQLANTPSANVAAYHHDATNIGDINGDGFDDFSVAVLQGKSKIFYGDGQEIFKLGASFAFSEDLNNSASATAVLPKEGLVVFLPYRSFGGDGASKMNIVDKNGVVASYDARTGVIPNDFGYYDIKVADINGDGRTDFVAIAEGDYANSGNKVFVTFIQKPSGGFEIFNSFPNEPQVTPSNFTPYNDGKVWTNAFSLVDMDGDKKLDLFWGTWVGGRPEDLRDSVFYGDGTGKFYRDLEKSALLFKDITWESGTRWDAGARTAAFDLDGDGLGDIIVFSSNEGQITPLIYYNNGTFG